MIEYRRTGCSTVFQEVIVPDDPVAILTEKLIEVETNTEEFFTLKAARRHAREVQWCHAAGLDITMSERAAIGPQTENS